MGKSKRRLRRLPKRSPKKPPKEILLEQTSIQELKNLKKFGEYYIRFHSDYFSTLAYQRSQVQNEIKKVLMDATIRNYKLSGWKRVVGYKYSNKPLSVAGSLKTIGGRFNIGDIGSSLVTRFPALYIAEDFATALQEAFQANDGAIKDSTFTKALVDKASFTSVSLRGSLDFIIDLNQPQKLEPFVNLIKNFTVPDYIKQAAKKINQNVDIINSIPLLMNALLIPNWKDWPMLFDVPTTPQIFGELVANAGIDGILYPSKFTKKKCLAVFPQNFGTADSFIELEDESSPEVRIKRLDSSAWFQSANELSGI